MSEAAPRRRERRWTPEMGAWSGLALSGPLILMLLLFVAWPVMQVAIDSVDAGAVLDNYGAFFTDPSARKILLTTLGLSMVVTVLAVVLGGFYAWALRTVRSPWVRAALWLSVLVPFWMSTIVKTYAFTIVLGRRGIVNTLLDPVLAQPLDMLYTNGAVVVGMLYSMLPYAVLPLFVSFLTIDPDMGKAAQTLGASRTRAATSVIFPLAVPGLVATASIVFVITLGFYITPVLLGGPRSAFMATLVNQQIFTAFDYPGAAASAVVLIVVALITLAVAIRLVGRERLTRAVA